MRKKGEDYFQNITIQSEDNGFPEEQLRSLIQNKPLSANREDTMDKQNTATAWTEKKGETIADNSSNRSDQANVIAIYGSSHCLLPFGRNLSIEDPDGCLVSRSLAKKLFGDFPAEDQQVIWNGSFWTVRGVIPLSAHCLIVQTAGKNMGLSYNRISISLKKGENRKKTGENFILQNNLPAYILRLDYLFCWSWLPELIPGKWSDFSGWKNNWKKQVQEKNLVKQMERSTLESTGLALENQSRLFLLSGLLLCIGGTLVLRRKSQCTITTNTK